MAETEPNKYEPLGTATKEVKIACKDKVLVRKIDGQWLPEFVGDNLTRADLNRIVQSLNAGYRSYQRLSNLQRRLAERSAEENKDAKKE